MSNSLVALLESAGVRPKIDYLRYPGDLESIVGGLDAYRRRLPVSDGELEVTYFDNLLWDGEDLSRRAKPKLERTFNCYSDYRSFLDETAASLAENAVTASREHRVAILTSVSTGYDSPAASVIARRMGCTKAVTIDRARSVVRRSDSGKEIGEALGLEVQVFERDLRLGEPEVRHWAAMGRAQDANLGIFDYPSPVCLFLTGFHGDKVWTTEEHDTSDRIVRGDTTGLGFTEDRVHRAVLHCPVPYWGVRRMDEIARITESSEMDPWRLGNDYDRPIPRRMVEEAGVAREVFGQTKSATTAYWKREVPHTRNLRRAYFEFVEEAGYVVGHPWLSELRGSLQGLLQSVEDQVPWDAKWAERAAPPIPNLQFQWALERMLSRSR